MTLPPAFHSPLAIRIPPLGEPLDPLIHRYALRRGWRTPNRRPAAVSSPAGDGLTENLETRADTGNTARGPSERRVTYELGTAPGLPPLDTGGGILYTLFGT